MGSVLVSDVAPDFARFPHSMMVDGHSDSAGLPQQQQRPRAPTDSRGTASARRSADDDSEPATRRGGGGGGAADAEVGGSSNSSRDSSGSGSGSASAPSHSLRASHEVGYDQAGFPLADPSGRLTGSESSPPSPQLLPTMRSSQSLTASGSGSPTRIKVRDLNHIQAFASEEVLARSSHSSRPSSLRGRFDAGGANQQYEISSMPVTDIIEMVAGLLTRVTTTNDRQHQHESFHHRHLPSTEGASALSQQTASVLSFHGKNIPSITILSYLSRIHKYCPTTYEVFLSLLVYFDRMTEAINNGTLRSFRSIEEAFGASAADGKPAEEAAERPGSSDANADLVDSDDESTKSSHVFVVDSYNIHRLVIAGVTCASKFFSDVFYTNSRYAKVGGLPIHELNHLELQFLLLNDFRLSVPVEELEAYGSMLVEFYAKEVVAQQMSSSATSTSASASGGDALYMQSSSSGASAQ